MMFGCRHHHAVDEHAGDLHLLGFEHTRVGDPFDLDDDQAAGVVDRRGDGEGLEEQRLALHGDVAVRVGGRAAQECHIQPLERLVEEVLLAADGHQLDAVLGGLVVDLSAAVARVDERVQANPGEQARLTGSGVAEQLCDHTLRQVVGLDLVVDGHLAQLARHPPVPADGPLQQALVAQAVEPAPFPVALRDGERQREIRWRTGLQESRLQRQGQFLGEALPGKTLHHDGVAVADQRHGLGGGDALVRGGQAGQRLGGKLHLSHLLFGVASPPQTHPRAHRGPAGAVQTSRIR